MIVTESEVKIFLDDLKEDIQKEFLKAMGMETSKEGNYDIFPIVVVPLPKIDDGEIMDDMMNKELTEDKIKTVRDWALPKKT